MPDEQRARAAGPHKSRDRRDRRDSMPHRCRTTGRTDHTSPRLEPPCAAAASTCSHGAAHGGGRGEASRAQRRDGRDATPLAAGPRNLSEFSIHPLPIRVLERVRARPSPDTQVKQNDAARRLRLLAAPCHSHGRRVGPAGAISSGPNLATPSSESDRQNLNIGYPHRNRAL